MDQAAQHRHFNRSLVVSLPVLVVQVCMRSLDKRMLDRLGFCPKQQESLWERPSDLGEMPFEDWLAACS